MIQPDDEALKARLILAEGRVEYAYPDSRGFLTIGIGHLVDKRKGGGLPGPIIDALYAYDVTAKFNELDAAFPWWKDLDDARQRVMAELVFNMGARGLSEFTKFLAAMQSGDWVTAGAELKDSRAYGQEPRRFDALIATLESGEAPPVA
jgi:lysozyme